MVVPRGDALFAGKVDPAALSFFEWLAVRMVKSPVGDRRDWDRICRLAHGLAPMMR